MNTTTCEYTWNPGHWPYTARLQRAACTVRHVQGEDRRLCQIHALEIDQEAH